MSAACGDDPAPAAPPPDTGSPDVTQPTTDGGTGDADATTPACLAQSFTWATLSKSEGAMVDVRGITRDPAGNTWVAGFASGNAKWDDVVLSTDLQGTAFVASLDTAGKVRFAKTLVPAGIGSPDRIKADSQGNVYVSGSFEGDVTLGTTTLSSTTAQIFVVKLDPNGGVLWARQSTGTGNTVPYGLAVDAQGSVYVTGSYTGASSFGATALPTSNAATVAFAAKYTAAGDVGWARGWTTASAAGGTGIAANADGTAIVVGYMSRRIDFDSYVVGKGVQSTTASFVVKVDASGKALWAADIVADDEKTDRAQLLTAATDGTGNAYVAGYASGMVGLGSAVAPTVDAGDGGGDAATPPDGARTSIQAETPNHDMMLARYDAAGQLVWVRQAGGPGVAAAGVDVGVNDGTGVYVVGSKFYGQPTFGTLTPKQTGVLFLARYDAQGTIQSLVGNDGANDKTSVGEVRALALGAPGSGVVVGGSLTGTWKFGDVSLAGSTTGSFDDRAGFVARVCE